MRCCPTQRLRRICRTYSTTGARGCDGPSASSASLSLFYSRGASRGKHTRSSSSARQGLSPFSRPSSPGFLFSRGTSTGPNFPRCPMDRAKIGPVVPFFRGSYFGLSPTQAFTCTSHRHVRLDVHINASAITTFSPALLRIGACCVGACVSD